MEKKNCKWCGKEFEQTYPNQKYCSKECSYKQSLENNKKWKKANRKKHKELAHFYYLQKKAEKCCKNNNGPDNCPYSDCIC